MHNVVWGFAEILSVFLSDSQPGTKLNMAKQELKVKTNKPEML